MATTASSGYMKAVLDCKCSAAEFDRWIRPAFPDTAPSSGGITIVGTTEIIHVGREHWLVCAPLSEEANLIGRFRKLELPDSVSLVEVSDSLRFFSFGGSDLYERLSRMTSLDVRNMHMPGATLTEAFGLKVLLVRRLDQFELGFDSSYARMIEEVLKNSGSSFDW